MPAPQSDWLKSTLAAVREVMQRRVDTHSLDAEAERDLKMALEELDVMWEELQGQADLLQRESRRYQEFFEFAPDAYLITDAGGSVREANRAATELLGIPRGTLVGRPLAHFVAEEDRTLFLSRFVTLVLEPTGEPASWTCTLQPPGAAPLQAAISVRAIPLRKSGIAGLCWLVRPA
jgi:PAS domain-containing protein